MQSKSEAHSLLLKMNRLLLENIQPIKGAHPISVEANGS